MHQSGTDSLNLVGADRGADTATADRDAAFHVSRRHRSSQRDDKIRIVVALIQVVGAEIHYLVPCRAELPNQLFLSTKAAMIRGNS